MIKIFFAGSGPSGDTKNGDCYLIGESVVDLSRI